MGTGDDLKTTSAFSWEEWKMESATGDSSIEIPGWYQFFLFLILQDFSLFFFPGRPVSVSAAYSGRIAVAYQSGSSYEKMDENDHKSR